MSLKIFDDGLVTTRRSKATSSLNTLAYIGMCFLELSKVSMYQDYYLQTLIVS